MFYCMFYFTCDRSLNGTSVRSSRSSEHGSRGAQHGCTSSQQLSRRRRLEGLLAVWFIDEHSSQISDALRVGLRPPLPELREPRPLPQRSSLGGGEDLRHGSKQSSDGTGLGHGGLQRGEGSPRSSAQSKSEQPAQQLSSSNFWFTSRS